MAVGRALIKYLHSLASSSAKACAEGWLCACWSTKRVNIPTVAINGAPRTWKYTILKWFSSFYFHFLDSIKTILNGLDWHKLGPMGEQPLVKHLIGNKQKILAIRPTLSEFSASSNLWEQSGSCSSATDFQLWMLPSKLTSGTSIWIWEIILEDGQLEQPFINYH